MGNTLYRRLDEDLPIIDYAVGTKLIQADGHQLIDLSGGPGCSCLGHDNWSVIKAIKDQLERAPFVFSGFWGNEPAEEAGDLIAELFEAVNPGWFGKVMFQGGGSEAVDLACKTAVQFHAETACFRHTIASLDIGFHGVTTLTYALSSAYPRFRMLDGFTDVTRLLHHRSLLHPLRTDGVEPALRFAKQVLAENVWAAVILEPIGGPPVGCMPLPKEYLQGIRKLCDDYGTLLIYDEVFCGSGRTGHLSNAELFDVWPDITILGKGLTGGYQPMSAIVLSQKVVDRINAGSKTIMWGTTYSAHPLGCAAVAATLRYCKYNSLYGLVRLRAPTFKTILMEVMHDTCPRVVSQTYATGFLFGMRLMDPVTQKPFDPRLNFFAKVRDQALKNGVVVYAKGGTIDGREDFIILAPAFEMSEVDFREGVKILARSVNEVLEQIKRS